MSCTFVCTALIFMIAADAELPAVLTFLMVSCIIGRKAASIWNPFSVKRAASGLSKTFLCRPDVSADRKCRKSRSLRHFAKKYTGKVTKSTGYSWSTLTNQTGTFCSVLTNQFSRDIINSNCAGITMRPVSCIPHNQKGLLRYTVYIVSVNTGCWNVRASVSP